MIYNVNNVNTLLFAERENVLYRFLTREHDLLYVGISMSFANRLRKHRDDKWWWSSVGIILIERHPTREAVLEAERRAIQMERPLHNIQLNNPPANAQPYGLTPCPSCGIDSFYRADMDRYYHHDGTDNLDCWIALSE